MQDMDQLYKAHFQTVYKYIFCLTHDAYLSEEITQETFYQALKTLSDFRGDCKISVWLCQIAKHIWIKEHQRKARYDLKPLQDHVNTLASDISIPDEMIRAESKRLLYSKLQEMEEKTRLVMYLRLTGELSFREIGEILGIKENWARVTFYRGKQKLMKEGLD